MLRFPLPERWSAPELINDVIVADGVTLHRAGVSTVAQDGEEICGSAAGTSPSVVERGWFELVERVSVVEAMRADQPSLRLMDSKGRVIGKRPRTEVFPESPAPERWRYARSNGVALHVDWETACVHALYELVERDRVLRSWYGWTLPTRLALDVESSLLAPARSYEWQAYAFSDGDGQRSTSHLHVIGLFGFPKNDELPFVLGFACRPDASRALEAAMGEALQLLSFLWGEEKPCEAPPGPTAMHHLDLYQVTGRHRIVRRWLEGQHAVGGDATISRGTPIGFVDLTPPWLLGGFRVAKAICDDALPLIFGESPYALHLPADRRSHPIP